MTDRLFSDELSKWLHGKQKKTIRSLSRTFKERTHAVAMMLFLLPSALPIPTGGVTNVLEVLAMIIAIQLIIGRKSVWIPQRWQDVDISGAATSKLVSTTISITKRAEKYRPLPLGGISSNTQFLSVAGLLMLIFTLGAFVAPPFSGLDTLPSMAVVLIALSILLEDGLTLMLGLVLGVIGLVLGYSAWDFVFNLFR